VYNVQNPRNRCRVHRWEAPSCASVRCAILYTCAGGFLMTGRFAHARAITQDGTGGMRISCLTIAASYAERECWDHMSSDPLKLSLSLFFFFVFFKFFLHFFLLGSLWISFLLCLPLLVLSFCNNHKQLVTLLLFIVVLLFEKRRQGPVRTDVKACGLLWSTHLCTWKLGRDLLLKSSPRSFYCNLQGLL